MDPICARSAPLGISSRMASAKVSLLIVHCVLNTAINSNYIKSNIKDLSAQHRESFVNITRFLTYFGMCVATCVIFQSSTHIAYIVGGAVAIYIAASEYWLNSTAQVGPKPEIDTKQLEDLIMKSL